MDEQQLSELAIRANRSARPTVVIDGGSGAGKSSLAQALVARLGPGAQLVSLDACYPGWRGLSATAELVPEMLRSHEPGYWSWNWQRQARADWHPIQPDRPLVVEGCGALSIESAPLATFRIWIELDTETRKERARLRDPIDFDSWWDLWAEQEHRHWRRNRPWDLADVTIDATQ